LAQGLSADHVFDLENPADAVLFDAPQQVLEPLQGLVVIDEVQRDPKLFPLLRYLVDRRLSAKFVTLGSASPDLMRGTAESLAGRIGYHPLGGFRVSDVCAERIMRLWTRGGLPRSFLAETEEASALWRSNFISAFLDRDLAGIIPGVPPRTMRRFWTMAAGYHGRILNYSEFARSFGVSDMTVRRYLDLLEGTYMVRLLTPWHANIGKRLVRQPKLYLRDSGPLHSLLAIEDERQLLSNPKLGASWEGFVLEEVIKSIGTTPE
jgi:predicted AAA+ superfamily ATPase